MTNTLLRAGARTRARQHPVLPGLLGAFALMTSTAMCTQPALAQQASVYQHVDGNGVDLVDGSFNFSIVEGGIGTGKAALSLVRTFGAGGERDNLSISFSRSAFGTQASIGITIGNRREDFTGASSATSFTSGQAEGATLTKVNASEYVYRDAGGTVTTFAAPPGLTNAGNNGYCAAGSEASCSLIATSTVAPDGSSLTYQWDVGENCFQSGIDRNGEPIFECAQFWRQRGVTNSYGYALSFSFATEANPTSGLPTTDWHRRIGATFSNYAVSGSPLRGVSYAMPSTGVTEITTDGGHVWRLSRDSQMRLSGIRRPGSSADNLTIGYAGSTSLVVNSVTRDGIATSYNRSVSGSTGTMTATDAASGVTTVTSNLAIGRPTAVTDPLNRTTAFQYDSNGRLTRTTFPENNYVQLTLDARGNVTQTDQVSKSGATTLTTSASYATTCSNLVTCNQPNSITDARGATTDFSYNATHGGVTSVLGPAPTSGADRPETRYTYTQTHGEYQLTSVSACAAGTAPSCVGTANESRLVLAYDANGNVISRETRDGTGALSATTVMTHTSAGDVATVDGPLSGTADTIHFRHDQARQVVGAISPDPDGSGGLTRRAVRTTYDSATGLPSKQEAGTVAGPGDTDWAAFSAAQGREVEYDASARPVVQRLTSGGATYSLIQTSYDSLGRLRCTAQRMNPAEFATSALPSDACTLDTEGTFGPDRITRTSYDAAGQVTNVETGVGVSGVAADEVTTAYSNNGRVAHVTDGEGNRTTYLYDGHDRLQETRFPDTTQGAGTSSSTDLIKYQYDENSNIVRVRQRDATNILFTFDALNRPTAKDLPGSELDVSYSYDLLGRLTGASQSGNALSFTYDPLGRNLTQVGPQGTVASAYDAAGRRTRLTYPGSGLYVDYDYLVTGETTHIRENGASSGVGVLATFGYDHLGRRTTLTRGNGTVTSYEFDAVSRLDELVQDLSGTANDLTLGFTHNPASQIVGNTRSNDAFSFTGLINGSVSDTHNGLNQVTATGATSVSHDARGNISAIGSSSYGYSSENLLTSGPAGVTLAYDPMLRLYQTSGTTTTRFAYDGRALIAEHDGSNTLLRRYVHGPGVDEPLVQYEGAGTSDRRFLHADERGSVVALTDSAGALVGTLNVYDEYGNPQGSMNGRFGYTGQTWIPELSSWYHKARMYNPVLSRFMQSDPIGYRAGMNLYAYVSGDPVNFIDPFGLSECKVIELRSWHVWNGVTGEYLGTEDGEVHTTYTICSGGGTKSDTGGDGGGVQPEFPGPRPYPTSAEEIAEALTEPVREKIRDQARAFARAYLDALKDLICQGGTFDPSEVGFDVLSGVISVLLPSNNAGLRGIGPHVAQGIFSREVANQVSGRCDSGG